VILGVIEYRLINYVYDFPDTGHHVSINIAFCHECQQPTDPLRNSGSKVQIVLGWVQEVAQPCFQIQTANGGERKSSRLAGIFLVILTPPYDVLG
jgi:hypothetical protein